MAVSDGNGWVECDCGSRHWGRHGAAGLMLVVDADSRSAALPPDARVLLQHRAAWSHEGGTWGLPGGARDSHEDVVTAALRETFEETGIDAAGGDLWGIHRADHGPWSYTTVLMGVESATGTRRNRESEDLRWVRVDEVDRLRLHPGFAAAWPALRGPRVEVLVDVANVMGSRPDGWWRDRLAAAQRLLAEMGAIVGSVQVPSGALVASITAVVEGEARAARSDQAGVLVVAASTADEYLSGRTGPGQVVVTADRGLADLVRRRGAAVLGPRWLLRQLSAAEGGR